MPDPRVANVPSSSPELVNGIFHVISKTGRKITNALAKLAGPGVKILGIDSEVPFTPDDVKKLGPQSKRKLRNKGIVTQLIPDYSAEKPFTN